MKPVHDAITTTDTLIEKHKESIRKLEELRRSLVADSTTDNEKYMSLTYDDVQVLKALRDKAISEGRDRISFKYHVLLVDYAKYLIEYMSTQFDDTRR